MTDQAKANAVSGAEGVLSSIEEIIEEMRNGRMVILVDAPDRENEGDLVIPAQMATPDAINFMAKYGRGLICLTLTQARAHELRLQEMVRSNRSRNRTAFTQSIEAREGISTGISAADRAHTIATAIDPTRTADDIVSPGHVFPIAARQGGVLIRAGHTEASVDLARLAGLLPAAVICEVMNDDGSMARLPDLLVFARQHGLKIGTIEDLIAYRLRHDRIVRPVAVKDVDSAFGGEFKLHVFETLVEPVEHLALVKGDICGSEPVLVRVHAVNPLVDLMGVGGDARSGAPIASAMRAISEAGRGVLVLIRDMRARGVSEWIAQHAGSGGTSPGAQSERRQVEIGVGSQILRELGVTNMVLMTNKPDHVYVGLEAFGLSIVDTREFD